MTRHDLKEQLKHDKFQDSVASVVDYTSSHRQQVVRWSIAGVIVLLLAGGLFWYSSQRRIEREHDLEGAFQVLTAQVGPAQPNQVLKSYPTEDAKRQASLKALSDVIAKDGDDSREGRLALYYRGAIEASQNDPKAEGDLKKVADSSGEASGLAKIALAEFYAGENKMSDAHALLRQLVEKPTDLISQQQAQLLLVEMDKASNPQEAKTILKNVQASAKDDPVVARVAGQISSELNK